MFRLTKNISSFKNIKVINLKDCNITTYSEKYITQIKKQKIKIISSELKPMKKESFGIILGGSTNSGKTTFIKSYMHNELDNIASSVGVQFYSIKNPKDNKINFIIYDTPRWTDRYTFLFNIYMRLIDGAILLFDLSSVNDIDELPFCLEIFENYFELEEFPILLVGTKADIEMEVHPGKISDLMEKY